MSPLNYAEKLCFVTDIVDTTTHLKEAASHGEKRIGRVDPADFLKKPSIVISDLDTDALGISSFDEWVRKWNRSLSSKVDIVGTLSALVWTLQIYQVFLRWNETRTDIQGFALLHDPVLHQLTPVDYSLPLFFLVYGSVILALVVYGRNKPDFVMELLQAKTCVIYMRMMALYLVPLEAPMDTIPLIDPIAGSDGIVLMRDLFFSGHTATTFLVFLTCRRHDTAWKGLFFVMAATTAIMVTLQKTHYAIDVFAAPFFVYTCHGLVFEVRSACRALHIAGNLRRTAALQ
ncbi:hypothetical protein H257_01831 [Aphanomyces astaci]|uniref:Sphingomyelin synthase-like domain-containing protein n=1 Tax=Aphanomyces astaci TaxID=112090 RepID=W4H633_APHAT|nr:hypothetical protein H257_01831 [Aphanomyces astaci]ETV86739.1 hypothetical protein H257_01831 [Aphanomyces astaci]|eukprot:XP_009823538.1 hypothetical protein H257_01831 [Aphanomyces astaci]